MDSYRVNCRNNSGNCRNRSCGNMMTAREMPPMRGETTERRKESCKDQEASVQEHLQMLPLAMAYVPMQKFGKTFEPARGFQLGTIFPELCKPFCGKGGGCRR